MATVAALSWVRVYEDPESRQQLEGVARIVRYLGRPAGGRQRLVVNFPDNGPDTAVTRLVDLRDITTGPAASA